MPTGPQIMLTVDRVMTAPPEAVWDVLVDVDDGAGMDAGRGWAAVRHHRVRTRTLLGMDGGGASRHPAPGGSG
jgi:hypothetical protein